jgi:hypothetical protein
MFSIMLDKAVGQFANAELLMRKRINQQVVQTFVPFSFNGSCTIGKGFLDERDDVGLAFIAVALHQIFGRRFVAGDEIGEKIIGSSGMDDLLGKAALRGCGLEVVFVLGKIFRHVSQFASDVVPRVDEVFGRRVRRFNSLGVLGMGSDGQGRRKRSRSQQGCGEKRVFCH